MEYFFSLVVLFEVLELSWQRGDNFQDYFINLYKYYTKSVLLFFALHPTFYLSLYFQLYYNNFSFLASAITILKGIDLVFKISVLDKITKGENLGVFTELFKENVKISPFMRYFGLVFYPTLYYLAYFS